MIDRREYFEEYDRILPLNLDGLFLFDEDIVQRVAFE